MFSWAVLLFLASCSFSYTQADGTVKSVFKHIESLLSAVLFPKCANSEENEEKLQSLADKMKPESKKFLRMVKDLDKSSEKSENSIDGIIRDIEVAKIEKAIKGANPKVLFIRNAMQSIDDALYQVLALIRDNYALRKIVPAIKGIINIHTTLTNFLTVKFFCLVDRIIDLPLKQLKALLKMNR